MRPGYAVPAGYILIGQTEIIGKGTNGKPLLTPINVYVKQ
jgi:hypothetical protein